MNSEMSNDEIFPVGCEAKHLLSACPVFQKIVSRPEMGKSKAK